MFRAANFKQMPEREEKVERVRPDRAERRQRRNFAQGLVQAEIARRGFEIIETEQLQDEVRVRVGFKLRPGHPSGLSIVPVGRVRVPRTWTEKTRDELQKDVVELVARALGSAAQEPILRDK